jgi:hypothetical protein
LENAANSKQTTFLVGKLENEKCKRNETKQCKGSENEKRKYLSKEV